ncbi:MAG TPA: hypothetical protein VLF60_05715 [Candidatus Saccharimonadales bacterium]|nr:hypothetical protein [Candidatus Saccharimonadales bacterium]
MANAPKTGRTRTSKAGRPANQSTTWMIWLFTTLSLVFLALIVWRYR